jgi:hypothetical protein
MTRFRPLTFALLTIALFTARPVLAGPPLLCFPFDIGPAQSLPMGTGGWKAIDPSYDVSRLVDDTVALLGAGTPVIVHMETIRRATVYASTHPAIAEKLLTALQSRAAARSADAPLAVFDFGYLVETFKEAKPIFSAPVASLDQIDGYQLVLKAQAIQRDETMARAAKLIEEGQPTRSALK